MKNILFLLICFLLATQCAHAQNFTRDGYPADSLGVSGDTAFYIAVGYKQLGTYETFPALNEEGVDSNTVARFAFRFIQDNESQIAAANRAVLKQRDLTKGYPQANQIINRFSGQNYIKTAWGEFQSRFAGYWRADSASVERYYVVFPEDTLNFKARDVYRINAQGNPTGAKLGTFIGVTNESFQTSIYPHLQTGVSGARWVSLNQGGRQFLSLNSGWRWVWLGRTFGEAQVFIQSLQGG